MSGDGGKYSRRKYLRALEHLAGQHPTKFSIQPATKETYKITWLSGDPQRPYPVAANGTGINRFIAEQLGKLLEKHGVCSKEDFLSMIS